MCSFIIEVIIMFDYVPHIFVYVCGYTTQARDKRTRHQVREREEMTPGERERREEKTRYQARKGKREKIPGEEGKEREDTRRGRERERRYQARKGKREKTPGKQGKEREDKTPDEEEREVGWLLLYSISTSVGYLRQNLVYLYIYE